MTGTLAGTVLAPPAVSLGEPVPGPGGGDRHVILSSVSSDAHTWNLIFLQLLLEETGYRVTNLGACTPDQLIVAECLRQPHAALVISTVNGHGYADGARLIARVREQPTLRGMPAVIGGKLGIDGLAVESRTAELIEAGFDAVFPETTPLPPFVDYMRALPRPAAALAAP